MSVNVSKVSAPAIAMLSSLESRVLIWRLAIGALIGLCVGALIGGLAFAAMGTDTTATAFLRLKNPADLTAIAGGASQVTPDNQANTSDFVAGEIAFLSGEGFAQAVSRKMAKDEPAELNIAQASDSAVVTISCSSGSASDAIRTLQAALDIYGQNLEQRVDGQVRRIMSSLSDWERRDPGDSVRTQELVRLRESIELQAADAATLDVLQPPTPNDRSTQQWVIGVILGGLIGGSGALVFVLARNRRLGRGAVVEAVTEASDGILLPAVRLDIPPRAVWSDEQIGLARTLFAQCPSQGPSRLVVVVGASAASGAATVATLLEAGSAAPSQPQSIAAQSRHSSTTDIAPAPHATEVISAGAVGDSTLTPELLGIATDIVLVVRLDGDTLAQALALRSAVASSAAPVVAAFTYSRRSTRPFHARDEEGPG